MILKKLLEVVKRVFALVPDECDLEYITLSLIHI